MPPPTSKAEQFRARANDVFRRPPYVTARCGVGDRQRPLNGQRVLITWLWIEWNSINSDASLRFS